MAEESSSSNVENPTETSAATTTTTTSVESTGNIDRLLTHIHFFLVRNEIDHE